MERTEESLKHGKNLILIFGFWGNGAIGDGTRNGQLDVGAWSIRRMWLETLN
jgi:hypothetical protein